MNPVKRLLIPGFVFLANGMTLLLVGLATRLTVFGALAPSCIALGVVFLAIARSRKSTHGRTSSPA